MKSIELKEYIFEKENRNELPFFDQLHVTVEYTHIPSELIEKATHWEPAQYSEEEIEIKLVYLTTDSGYDLIVNLDLKKERVLIEYLFNLHKHY